MDALNRRHSKSDGQSRLPGHPLHCVFGSRPSPRAKSMAGKALVSSASSCTDSKLSAACAAPAMRASTRWRIISLFVLLVV